MKDNFKNLEFLVNHLAPEFTITHNVGTDNMGSYEYWEFYENEKMKFSSTSWCTFVNSVLYRLAYRGGING